MYDTLVDIVVRQNISFGNYALFSKSLSDLAAMQADWQAHKALVNFKPSFKEHIYPILCSIARVMRIHLRAEGELTKYHLSLDPMHYGLLGGPNSDRNARKEIFDLIRDPKTLRNPASPLEPKKSHSPSATITTIEIVMTNRTTPVAFTLSRSRNMSFSERGTKAFFLRTGMV